MKIARIALASTALFTAMVVTACGDSPLAPPTPPVASSPVVNPDLLGFLGNTLRNVGLLSCSQIPAASASKVIGPGGGTITVGPHTLVIPAGALNRNVTIKGSIKPENVRRITFEPSGLDFDKPVSLTMSYANCSLLTSLLPKGIAYTGSNLNILQHLLSIDNLLQKKVTAKIGHFSDYAVEESAFSDYVNSW